MTQASFLELITKELHDTNKLTREPVGWSVFTIEADKVAFELHQLVPYCGNKAFLNTGIIDTNKHLKTTKICQVMSSSHRIFMLISKTYNDTQ